MLEPVAVESDTNQERARQLLRRYGIVFPELLARERMAPRWRELVSIYRRMEARGEIRGGRFVSGFVGEQFALPEAVTEVREASKREPSGQMTVISACDPLNLVGILSPGDKVPAVLGNRVVYRDGVPVASLESGNLVGLLPESQSGDLNRAFTLLRLGSSAAAWETDSLSSQRPA